MTCSVYVTSSTTVCAVCRDVRYCSQSCQKHDWPAHKNVCKSPLGARPSEKHARALYFSDTDIIASPS